MKHDYLFRLLHGIIDAELNASNPAD